MTIGLADKDWRGMYLRDTAMLTDKIEIERIAAIEQCAQKLDELAQRTKPGSIRAAFEHGAAKIRAMKEQP